ncbi:MAG: family N-acetyltransferase [Solirubrobacterales bacterium]|nr:family N-acetyltransferase [Solirubrobacterales bacterium]
MLGLTVRPVPLEHTRSLRRDVLRPHLRVQELAAHEPPGAVAFGAFDGEELVGVGLVGADGSPGAWRIRGMATAPHARGRGAGTAVLDALVRHAVQQGATRVWCNARTPALSLYRRAGFSARSDEFELPAIGPHVVMELALGRHHEPTRQVAVTRVPPAGDRADGNLTVKDRSLNYGMTPDR